MEKKISIRVLAEIAIFAALAIVLDKLAEGIFRGIWINGGSITIALVPIAIICYRRGFLAGFCCSVVVALLNMLGGIYSIADSWYKVMFQVLLDYVIAYPLVSVCGLFSKLYKKAETKGGRALWLSVGIGIGGTLKFISHFLAGVLFWPADSWNGVDFSSSAALYSFVYNVTYVLPSVVISIGLVILISMIQPQFLNIDLEIKDSDVPEEVREKKIVGEHYE